VSGAKAGRARGRQRPLGPRARRARTLGAPSNGAGPEIRRASRAAHHPALPRNAARPARGAARDRPGRSSRCGPASPRGRGRRQRTQARTDSRSCCLAVPGRCGARHARHVPEAAARQITKPDSAVHSCRDDRRSRSVAIACRKSANATATWGVSQTRGRRCSTLHRALHGCDVPPHVQKSRVRDSTLPFTGWRSSSADCAPPATVSVASMGSPKKGTARHKRPAPGNALPGDVDVIRRGAGQDRLIECDDAHSGGSETPPKWLICARHAADARARRVTRIRQGRMPSYLPHSLKAGCPGRRHLLAPEIALVTRSTPITESDQKSSTAGNLCILSV
jgi:hypothetical protein